MIFNYAHYITTRRRESKALKAKSYEELEKPIIILTPNINPIEWSVQFAFVS